MTIEEAIEILDCYDMDYVYSKEYSHKFNEARNMVIKAVEQEPCDDAISRLAALKELKESAEHHANDSREEALLRRDRDIIRALPPVRPQEPKTGYWIRFKEFENGYYHIK